MDNSQDTIKILRQELAEVKEKLRLTEETLQAIYSEEEKLRGTNEFYYPRSNNV